MHKLVVFAVLLACGRLAAQPAPPLAVRPVRNASLKDGFAQPPARAKPRVWWHWMNGNVTKQGITADLEAMASAGIGGAHVFDVGCNVPPGDVKFATPSWDEHLSWAIREAERLGLELTLVNCSGYANAGGPWVAPSNSMFFVTHSETVLKGGHRYRLLKLPRETKDNGFYCDIATVAFPRPKCETDVPSDLAVTSPATNVFVLSAASPFTLRGLRFAVDYTGSWAWNRVMTLAVETSADGRKWTKRPPLKYRVVDGGKSDCDLAKGLERLAAFAEPLTARHVRLTADLTEEFAGNLVPPRLATVRPVFRAALPELNDRVFRTKGVVEPVTRDGAADEAVDPKRVVDLTDRLRPDGTLDWTPPPGGDWVVVRLGYCSNGVQSHPCSEFGGGFEVDKLDAAAVARHLDAYALKYADRKGVVSVLCDSYEVGSQNWTHGLERTFAARKGYSLVPYLAVALSGRVLGSSQKTDAALADFRRVLADLFAENFAGTFARKCAEHGVTAALEPYGNGPFDDTAYAWRATQLMTEFWVDENIGVHKTHSASYCRLAKEVASAAHLRGRAIVDAEGFTAFPDRGGRWLKDPFGLKAMGDIMYAHGVSRMVYHRWAHQPWTDPPRLPGMTMGPWGTHFERTETWWPMVGPWLTYQARCQYLLQEGAFVGDVLVFAGDDIPRRRQPEGFLPAGVDWDLCGRDALVELKVADGRIRCLGETTYALLLVPTNVTVAADSRARIDALRRAGARVVSALPAEWERDFRCADPARELFAQHRRYADGREGYFVAYPSTNATATVCSFRVSGKVPTIWDPETGRISRPPAWRRTGNRTEVTVPFRPCGAVFVMFESEEDKAAEPPEDANAKFAGTAVTGPWKVTFPIGWYVGSDEKKTVTLTNLVDWTTLADDDLKYFSGIATYETTVRVNPKGGRTLLDLGTVKNLVEVTVNGKTYPALWRPPYVLDITDALSTPKPFNPSTFQPFNFSTLQLSLRVANLWPNRLIGDERLKPGCEWDTVCLKEMPAWVKKGEPSPTGRHAFATWRHWGKDDPLQPSGLLGPVTVRVEEPSRGDEFVTPFPEFSAPRAITKGPHEHLFASYYGVNAWSPDGRYVLVLETDLNGRLPAPGEKAKVGVVDLRQPGEFIPVAETVCWNFQEGTMAHWLPEEPDTFVYNDFRNGKFVAVVVNWKTKAERIVPWPVSAVSADGKQAISINYARMRLTRPDYGYAGGGQDAREGVAFPEDDGLFLVDLKTGEAKLIVSIAQVRDQVPAVKSVPGKPGSPLSYFCHTVFSKDGKRVFWLSRSVDWYDKATATHPMWHTTAFTCDVDGGNVRRCFPDGWGASHFNWKDDKTMVVTVWYKESIWTHVEFTVGEEEKVRRLAPGLLDWDGHCLYMPGGKFMASDSDQHVSTRGLHQRFISLTRMADGAVKSLGTFDVPEPYRGEYWRCDLHGRFRPDGGQFGFNSVHEGSRQLYVMDVKVQPELKTTADTILCEGAYGGHLQGVATDGKSLFWSFTVKLVKTDLQGRLLASVDVPSHHGDLCVKDGTVYVAVNLGRFNYDNLGIGEVWAYAADDLRKVGCWTLPECVHGLGGLTFADDRFFAVGGLPATHESNYVYEYTSDFKFAKRHELNTGFTLMGIQTAAFEDGRFIFGIYGCPGTPAGSLECPRDLKSFVRRLGPGDVGIVKLGDEYWTGRARFDDRWRNVGMLVRSPGYPASEASAEPKRTGKGAYKVFVGSRDAQGWRDSGYRLFADGYSPLCHADRSYGVFFPKAKLNEPGAVLPAVDLEGRAFSIPDLLRAVRRVAETDEAFAVHVSDSSASVLKALRDEADRLGVAHY